MTLTSSWWPRSENDTLNIDDTINQLLAVAWMGTITGHVTGPTHYDVTDFHVIDLRLMSLWRQCLLRSVAVALLGNKYWRHNDNKYWVIITSRSYDETSNSSHCSCSIPANSRCILAATLTQYEAHIILVQLFLATHTYTSLWYGLGALQCHLPVVMLYMSTRHLSVDEMCVRMWCNIVLQWITLLREFIIKIIEFFTGLL